MKNLRLLLLSALVMISLLGGILHADAANYANVVCDCWTGTITSTAPCTCDCPSGFQQPYCAWTTTEMTKINIVSDISNVTDFSGSYMARRLRLKLGMSAISSDISFTIIDDANTLSRVYPNVIVGRFLINGSYATTLFNNVYLDGTGSWTSHLNISTVYPYYPDVQPAVGIQGDVWMEVSPGIFIHTYDVLWLIFLLIVCLIACIECCCCASNTEKKAIAELSALDVTKLAVVSAGAAVVSVSENVQPKSLDEDDGANGGGTTSVQVQEAAQEEVVEEGHEDQPDATNPLEAPSNQAEVQDGEGQEESEVQQERGVQQGSDAQAGASWEDEDVRLAQEEEAEMANVLNEQDVQRRKDIWADLKTRLPTDKKDKDQRRKRFDLFKEFDRNNNKYLTPEDLSHGCQAVLGLGQLKKGLAHILPKAHANARAAHEVKGKEKQQSKESIERCEFRLVFVEVKKLFDLWFMFDTMDVASSGFISETEFESGVSQLQEWGKDVQDPKAEFATIDVAGNGKISFTEFCDFATANQLQDDEEDTDNDEDPETEDIDEAHRRNAADVERRKKIWEDLAHRLPTNRKSKEERARRFAYFREFDTNGNGFLTLADVEAGCETVLGLGQLGKGLHHILPLAHNSARGVTNVKGQDIDANQHVEKSEMRLLFVYIHQYFDLWFLFDHLDVANSGQISEDEFGQGMAEVEKWADVTIEDPKTEFAEADTGKTGHLIFLEFCEWAHHKNKKDE